MLDRFDSEKFMKFKTKLLKKALLTGKDLGKAYRARYLDSYKGPDFILCYLLLIDDSVVIIDGVNIYEKWDINDLSLKKTFLKQYNKYGEALIKSSSFYKWEDNTISVYKDQFELLSSINTRLTEEKKQKEKEEKLKKAAFLKQKKMEEKLKKAALLKQKKKEAKMEVDNKLKHLQLSAKENLNKLLEYDQTYLMFYNLLDLNKLSFFTDITFFNAYEDDLISEILEIDKKSKFSIKKNVREIIEEVLYKFIKLLVEKNYMSKDLQGKRGLLIIIKGLKFVSVDYFAKKFSDSYSGYFINFEKMNLKQCIITYFSIDLIDKKDEINISLFTYFLIKNKKLNKSLNKDLFLDGFNKVKKQIDFLLENSEMEQFESILLKTSQDKINRVTIDDIDLMNGNEFENFIYDLFKKMGYSVNQTKTTGDQGIDVIAVKRGHKIGIQTKCYSNTVSNKAIQEVVAGIRYYNLSKGIVITNNIFTKAAIELGNSNGVVLWDRAILKEKIAEYY